MLSNADPASVARLSGWMGYFIAGFCRGFQKLVAPCSYEGQLMTVALLQNQQQALGRESGRHACSSISRVAGYLRVPQRNAAKHKYLGV